jgi:hypothetical protein
MPEATMVEATIEGVERNADTGWFRIKTSRGSFDTKIAEKAAEAVALQGENTRLWYVEGRASGNINQHTGQPFPPPRYYERAERLAAAGGNGGAVPGVVETSGRKGMTKDEVWRICLSVGVKAAVDTLPLLPEHERDFDSQRTIATAWGRFLFFTPAPDLAAEHVPFAGATADMLRSIDPRDPGPEDRPPVDDIPY